MSVSIPNQKGILVIKLLTKDLTKGGPFDQSYSQNHSATPTHKSMHLWKNSRLRSPCSVVLISASMAKRISHGSLLTRSGNLKLNRKRALHRGEITSSFKNSFASGFVEGPLVTPPYLGILELQISGYTLNVRLLCRLVGV